MPRQFLKRVSDALNMFENISSGQVKNLSVKSKANFFRPDERKSLPILSKIAKIMPFKKFLR